jgi:hypothetical protein
LYAYGDLIEYFHIDQLYSFHWIFARFVSIKLQIRFSFYDNDILISSTCIYIFIPKRMMIILHSELIFGRAILASSHVWKTNFCFYEGGAMIMMWMLDSH